MFDKLIRQLESLDGMKVSVPIALDDDGYLDRECPSQECQFQFKVFDEDWREKVRDEEVFCTFCGHTATSDKWATTEQVESGKKFALAQIHNQINTAMQQDAAQWNRSQPKNAFISMTMKVNSVPQQVLLPAMAADSMRLKIACPKCSCRYAAVGVAFFCPSCGHSAAELLFGQSIEGIRKTLDSISDIRSAIADRDTAETTVRLIVENGLQNLVMAFQRYAEVLYEKHPSAPTARRNAFQNIEEGSELWKAVAGKEYADYLTPDELTGLKRYFQQRHLLAHREGLIDASYITRSGDTSYREGQRIVIREATVRDCLAIVEKLTRSMVS